MIDRVSLLLKAFPGLTEDRALEVLKHDLL